MRPDPHRYAALQLDGLFRNLMQASLQDLPVFLFMQLPGIARRAADEQIQIFFLFSPAVPDDIPVADHIAHTAAERLFHKVSVGICPCQPLPVELFRVLRIPLEIRIYLSGIFQTLFPDHPVLIIIGGINPFPVIVVRLQITQLQSAVPENSPASGDLTGSEVNSRYSGFLRIHHGSLRIIPHLLLPHILFTTLSQSPVPIFAPRTSNFSSLLINSPG